MGVVMGIVGMATLLAIAVMFSSDRRAISLRTVFGALSIQIGLGAFVLFTSTGKMTLQWMSGIVGDVIQCGQQGIEFVFGSLSRGSDFLFAFRVLPVIVFFSSLISVLYYLGIMQLVIRVLGGALQKVLKTSRTESLSATANIFVGQTEAPLVVKPYIAKMTESELFAVMCGGMASVAGSVLAAYAGIGVKMEYLIAASFMAAPGGLLFAKILVPETSTPQDSQLPSSADDSSQPGNVIDAAAVGAGEGLKLALNVGAMLLAFVGLIAVLNAILAQAGRMANLPALPENYQHVLTESDSLQSLSESYTGSPEYAAEIWQANFDQPMPEPQLALAQLPQIQQALQQADNSGMNIPTRLISTRKVRELGLPTLSLELILGKMFAPLAFLIGVPWNEASVAGSFIGQKLIANEFIAYLSFAPYLSGQQLIDGAEMSAHTQAIVSFALCGFANLSSIAILIGGLGALAPSRRQDIARLGLKAVLAGSLSNLMSAAIAGFFLALSGG